MTRKAKLLEKLRSGKADNNLKFSEFVLALRQAGFEQTRDNHGSHHMFFHPSLPAVMLNIQPGKNGEAKGYQVRQAREELKKLTF